WDIDAHCYSDENIQAVLEVADQIRAAFPEPASDTLVTKVMLGVFGCIPAFDTFFKAGLEVWTFGNKSLHKVATFYQDNAAIIEKYRVPTLEFTTGIATKRRYTRAK